MEERFTKIYDKAIWGKNYKGEGGSGKGDGTSPDSTHYINLVMKFMKDNDIKTVCDIGAGDWKFSRFIPWKEMGITYLGVDVVKSVVESNTKEYSNDHISFKHGDALTFDCSNYDLVLIKDVLQHFKDEDVVSVCDRILPNNKFVITTNGCKFGRTPSKNNWLSGERSINNQYSYHPLCSKREPLLKYQHLQKEVSYRRYKEIIIFGNN